MDILASVHFEFDSIRQWNISKSAIFISIIFSCHHFHSQRMKFAHLFNRNFLWINEMAKGFVNAYLKSIQLVAHHRTVFTAQPHTVHQWICVHFFLFRSLIFDCENFVNFSHNLTALNVTLSEQMKFYHQSNEWNFSIDNGIQWIQWPVMHVHFDIIRCRRWCQCCWYSILL